MGIELNKEQVEAVMQEIKDDKYDALMQEGMEKIHQLGKYEGMMKLSKNMLLWSGGAYLTSALMKKVTFRSLSDITDTLENLKD